MKKRKLAESKDDSGLAKKPLNGKKRKREEEVL